MKFTGKTLKMIRFRESLSDELLKEGFTLRPHDQSNDKFKKAVESLEKNLIDITFLEENEFVK
jgi:hypothetical protein